MKLRVYVVFIFNTLIALAGFYLWLTYLQEMPDRIAVARDAEGIITARVPSKSIWILPLLFAVIYAIGIFAARAYHKIKFNHKDEFESIVAEEKRLPVYILIQESISVFIFILGIIIFYIQLTLVLLGLEKIKTFSFYPILILFVSFVLFTALYKKKIDKRAETLIKSFSHGKSND